MSAQPEKWIMRSSPTCRRGAAMRSTGQVRWVESGRGAAGEVDHAVSSQLHEARKMRWPAVNKASRGATAERVKRLVSRRQAARRSPRQQPVLQATPPLAAAAAGRSLASAGGNGAAARTAARGSGTDRSMPPTIISSITAQRPSLTLAGSSKVDAISPPAGAFARGQPRGERR